MIFVTKTKTADMITAIIIEENREDLERLKKQLSVNCPEMKIVASTTLLSDGVELIKKYKPDLVFLATQLENGSGFELLKQIPEHSFNTVFLSNDGKHAAEAFNFDAIHYLLKPINGELLKTIKYRLIPFSEKRFSYPLSFN